jgi:peptide/nickel transport system permease protein
MLKYLIKRILLFVPTIIAITILTFLISINTPGDPVEQRLPGLHQTGNVGNSLYNRSEYIRLRHEMGLDLPVFYFSVKSAALPDTLRQIPDASHREFIKRWVAQTGNWQSVRSFYLAIIDFDKAIEVLNNNTTKTSLKDVTGQILKTYRFNDFEIRSKKVDGIMQNNYPPGIKTKWKNVLLAFTFMQSNQTKWKNYIPSIKWYGFRNQYHQWIAGIFKGNFGNSYQSGRPVISEIGNSVGITLSFSLFAILLTYIIAVPLGIYSASKANTRIDHIISTLLFSMYSLPAFWIGTLLIIFLGGGDFLDWFPPFGLGNIEGLGFFEALGMRFHHLVLPLICLVYPTLAFLTRQARGSLTQVLQQDYIKTARAKGLPMKKVIWQHGFKNALLPIITLLANVFPYAIAGSVVVEIVFSIPGMGKLTVDAMFSRDYPIVYAIVMLSALMTMAGYLVADLLYASIDPRIQFNQQQNKTA